ncbi:MAG: MerR family transcriptional regulator [Rhodothermales bacterium]
MKKLYHSIREVASRFEVNTSVLRHWEEEFAELAPRRNRAGQRVYTEADIQVVARIKHLLREEKYTIEGARQVLRRGSSADFRQQLVDLRALLVTLRERLGTGESAPV